MSRKNIDLLLADTIFVLHVALAIFYLTGWMFPKIRAIYLFLMILWPLSWIVLGYCPPTKWEFSLRHKYDPSIDPNAEAIQYYVYKILGVKLSERKVFTFGLVVYVILIALSLYP